MPAGSDPSSPWWSSPWWRGPWAAAALAVVALLPFLGKAFTIDDPLFLWLAAHVQREPFDFFGFPVNWYGHPMPMHEVTKNPPLMGHLLGLAAAVVGWSEPALHAVCLLPAVAVGACTWFLGRRCAAPPLAAAALAVLTPAFLVSGSSVMCDMTMLALFTGSLAAFVAGLDRARDGRRHQGWLALGAGLAAAAVVTKYFGAAVIPLIAAYALSRRALRALPWLLVPVLALVAYELWTAHLYGRGLFFDAAEYRVEEGARAGTDRAWVGLLFAGGCAAPALLFAPWLWRRAYWIGLAVLALFVTVIVGKGRALAGTALEMRGVAAWSLALQAGLLTAGGVAVLMLVVDALRRWRNPESVLLGLWVAGTFVFATFVNWTNNGRSILPMVPAVGILIAARLAQRGVPARAWRVPLGLAGALAFAVALADATWADQVRAATVRMAGVAADAGRQRYITGHWGFQYYALRAGFRSLDQHASQLDPGDVLVVPSANSYLEYPSPDTVSLIERIEDPVPAWGRTLDARLGAGFYASNIGPLPFAFGSAGADLYQILRVRRPIGYSPREAPR